MKKFIISGLISVLIVLLPGKVSAHYLWLNVDNYNPGVGKEITISVGYGHNFPKDAGANADRLDKLFFIDPEGVIIPLEIKTEGDQGVVAPVKIRLNKEGTYLAVLTRKSGFVSKTTKGYIHKSKKELEGVLSSSWSEASATAIINVGSPKGESFQKEIEQRFQLIALKNPGKLKKSDYLPVKLILDRKPYRTWVNATYAGFSPERDTFAYTTRVNKEEMVAKIKILEKGVWLIKASDKIPYPDPEEADEFSFTSTFTFEVK